MARLGTKYTIVRPPKNNITYVSVLSRFKTSSDHRLVWATFRYNLHRERSKMFRKYQPKFEKAALSFLQKDRFELQNHFERLEEVDLDVDTLNKKIDLHNSGNNKNTYKECQSKQ